MYKRARTIARWATVAAVALTLIGLGLQNVEAEVIKQPDFGGPGTFKGACDRGGGTFTDTGDGNLWCTFEDGAQTVCDSNGNDCWYMTRSNSGGVYEAPGTGTATDSGHGNGSWEPLGTGTYNDGGGLFSTP